MAAALNQTLHAEQKLVLTQEMRQFLEVLQLPLPELREYVQEAELSNPLLEVEYPPDVPLPAEDPTAPLSEESESEIYPVVRERADRSDQLTDWMDFHSDSRSIENIAQRGESLTDALREQLLNMRRLDEATRRLCEYLIECLDERGYLPFSLNEIAAEQRVNNFQMEQALYLLQSLQPVGVGARTLEECLILQLSQRSGFNAHTVNLIHNGLPLLAKGDYPAIAKLLNCSRAEAMQAAEEVRALNPIPSRGYDAQTSTVYQVPEAQILIEKGAIVLEMNRRFTPRLHINKEISDLLAKSGGSSELAYLKRETASARQLILCVENRCSTIQKLLELIVQQQQDYFLTEGALHPMTMSRLAENAGLNISTVSRALQGKSILFRGKTLPLKNLFEFAIPAEGGRAVGTGSIKRQLQRFVDAEDKQYPLSDDELQLALKAVQMPVSRRTVAKYREELGISTFGKRKICQSK